MVGLDLSPGLIEKAKGQCVERGLANVNCVVNDLSRRQVGATEAAHARGGGSKGGSKGKKRGHGGGAPTTLRELLMSQLATDDGSSGSSASKAAKKTKKTKAAAGSSSSVASSVASSSVASFVAPPLPRGVERRFASALCANVLLSPSYAIRRSILQSIHDVLDRNGMIVVVAPSTESRMFTEVLFQRWDAAAAAEEGIGGARLTKMGAGGKTGGKTGGKKAGTRKLAMNDVCRGVFPSGEVRGGGRRGVEVSIGWWWCVCVCACVRAWCCGRGSEGGESKSHLFNGRHCLEKREDGRDVAKGKGSTRARAGERGGRRFNSM